jgi:hypothetical protein
LKKDHTLRLGAFLVLFNITVTKAQMITGVWSGKINRQKVEIKIIQEGDSLAGTSYYYESLNNYRRYSIKGYFDKESNTAIWWDDQLIEERSSKFSLAGPGKNALLSSADFNCPGGSTMMLDGKASLRDETHQPKGEVHLDKTNQTTFGDEWDFVIENYTSGANDPDIIDSVADMVHQPTVIDEPVSKVPEDKPVVNPPPVIEKPVELPPQKTATVKEEPRPVIKNTPSTQKPSIEEKYISRKKILTTEIPVSGDSIELRFYDNAEIDGDSISLFLNDKLIFEHIRLAATAYTIKIAVNDLKESNDLIMVAENLGTIPPNTSYMVAMVGEKRYDARLESTEGTSAMIRLTKAR